MHRLPCARNQGLPVGRLARHKARCAGAFLLGTIGVMHLYRLEESLLKTVTAIFIPGAITNLTNRLGFATILSQLCIISRPAGSGALSNEVTGCLQTAPMFVMYLLVVELHRVIPYSLSTSGVGATPDGCGGGKGSILLFVDANSASCEGRADSLLVPHTQYEWLPRVLLHGCC